MFKIGLDITMLSRPRTGVENYVRALADHLPGNGSDFEWVYFSAFPLAVRFPARVISDQGKVYSIWRETRLPRLLQEHAVDLLHSPIKAVPLRWDGPEVNTIQDMIWVKHPESYSFRRRLAHRVWVSLSVNKVRRVIVPSSATAADLLAFQPKLDRTRIRIIPLCAPLVDSLPASTNGDDLLRRHQIKQPFLLAVGTLQPRKNYVRLISAFERLRTMGLSHHQLVIVGNDGFGAQQVRDAVKRSLCARDIRLTGYIDVQQNLTLYRLADAAIYASLYEGFGIPLLEAMAMGTPVATSNTSSMPEVGGDAACYFDPTDVDAMSQVIYRMLTDAGLRRDLIQKGFERVKLFTPERMAAATVAVYREVLKECDRGRD